MAVSFRGVTVQTRVQIVAFVCACGAGVRIPTTAELGIADRGAEPRQLLRYKPIPGTSERAELTVKQRTHTAYTNTVLQDGTSDVDLPSIVVRGPMTIENVSAEGALVTFSVDDVTTLDDVVDRQVKRAFDSIAGEVRGRAMSWRRAATGKVTAVTANATIERLMGAVGATFPDEPIGIGGSWRVVYAFDASGVRWRATATHHVRDLSSSEVTIDTETELEAPEQPLSVEPNATVHLTSGHGHASSHAVIPLGTALPTQSTNATLEVNLLITRGRVRITATQTIEQITELRPGS